MLVMMRWQKTSTGFLEEDIGEDTFHIHLFELHDKLEERTESGQ